MYVHMYVCANARMMVVTVCMCVCNCVCMHACMYVCMYVCIYLVRCRDFQLVKLKFEKPGIL